MEIIERSEALETPALQKWIADEAEEAEEVAVSRTRRATGCARHSIEIEDEA